MRIAYEQYLKHREEMICDFLRQVLRNYSCKIQRNYLAFLQYRVIRMEQLKENIAILTVKKIWRAKKLSFKIVKEKFLRIKRRKAAMQNKEAYQKYLATLGGTNTAKKDPPKKLAESNSKDSKQLDRKGDENPEAEKNPEEDDEYKEAQRIKDIIDRKIKEKVAKGKLSYAIEGTKEKMILPMMQERALNEAMEEEENHSKLFYITMSVFAKGRSLSRNSRPKTRNTLISSPKELSQRRRSDYNSIFPKLSLISPANIDFEAHEPCNVKEIENANFLMATISSTNKAEEYIPPRWKINYAKSTPKKIKRLKLSMHNDGEITTRAREFKERMNHWVPVARRFSTYIPGIDNSGYQPQKWSPLPLDKRILKTAIPINTRIHTKAKSIGQTVDSNFNAENRIITSRLQISKRFQFDSNSPSTQDPSIDIINF